MSNKRFLKKLLATTAVVGTLATGAMEAQAVVAVTVGPAANWATGANIDAAAAHRAAGLPTGSTLIMGGAGAGGALAALNAAVGTVYNVNLYGFNSTLTLSNAVGGVPSILALANDRGAGAQAAAGVAILGGGPVAIGAADGAAIANLTYGDGSIFQINNDASLPLIGVVAFGANANATLNLNASGTITGSFVGGGGNGNAGTVAVLGGKNVVFKGANANMFRGAGDAIKALTGGAGSTITIDSTTAAQDLTGTKITFGNGAAAASTLNLIAAANALTSDAINGNVKLVVTGDNVFTAAAMGAVDRVISVDDTRSGAAVASTYADIKSTGNVTIDHSKAASLAITLGGIDTSTGNVVIKNKAGNIDLANRNIIATKGGVTLYLDPTAAGGFANASNAGVVKIEAGNGDIAITSSNAAAAAVFGQLIAIKGNTILTAGNAAGITATTVQTKELTFDAKGVGDAAAAIFKFGGANTALSTGLKLISNNTANATKGINLTIINGAAQYIGGISLTGATDVSTIDFQNAGGNQVYIGNVGSVDAKFLKASLNANGVVPIVDGSDVYINEFTVGHADSKIILGNDTTIHGSVTNAGAAQGIIQLQSVPGKTLDADSAVVISALGHTKVEASIIGNVGVTASPVAKIDFSQAAAGSSLTVGAAAADDDVTIATRAVTFSAVAGAVGTLKMTGGKDHTLDLTGGIAVAAANIAQGAISSDTANKFTIIGSIGYNGNAAPWTQGAISSISAANAANVILKTGNLYTKELVMKSGSILTLGDNAAGRIYLIGSLTDGVNIITDDAAANVVTLASGTNLGKFASLKLANNGGTFTFNDMDLLGANIDSVAANTGNYIFAGTSVVNSAIGANGGVAEVRVAPAAVGIKTNPAVTFNGDINSATGVVVEAVNADAVVKIAANITGTTPANAGITRDGAAGKAATVYFVNAANKPITIAGDIATRGTNFTAVNVGAGQVTVENAKTAATDTITFTDNGNLILQNLNAGVLNNTKITASKAGVYGTLTVDTDIDRRGGNGQIGASGLSTGAIAFSVDKTFTTDNNVYADLRTFSPGTSAAKFIFVGGANAADARTIQNVGTAENPFRTADFLFKAAGTATTGVINAVNSSLDTENAGAGGAGGSTLNLLGSTGILNLKNVAVSDILNYLDGATIGTVTTATASKGLVNIKGNATITGVLGSGSKLEKVAIQGGSAAKVVKLGVDINAPVKHDATTLLLTANSTINGTYDATDSSIALENYLLNVTGAGTFAGNISVTANLNQDPNNSGKSIGGQLAFKSLTAANANALNVTTKVVFDTRVALPTDDTKWNVISVADSMSAADVAKLRKILNLQISASNRFLALTQSVDEHGVYVTTKRDFSKLVSGARGTNARAAALAAQINAFGKNLTGSILTAVTDWGYVSDEQANEGLTRLTESAPQVATLASTGMMNAVSARTSAIGTSGIIEVAAADDLGAAAGDESTKMGGWLSGFGGYGKQGARKGDSGFNAKVYGGVVGFDTALNDSLIAGVAAGLSDVKVKYKNSKSGDKTSARTYLFSVYGSYDFGNNWISQASAMLGNGTVKNTALRVTSSGYQTATGKFDTVTGGAEVLGGYKFAVSDVSNVTPLAGLSYTKTNENGYTETGTTAQNLKISDRNRDKLEGILGLRASTQIDMDGTIITPEAHGFMNYDFKAKAPKSSVTLDGLPGNLSTGVAKPARTAWNLGAGVMAKTDMVDYGVTYDSQISDKYFGHQGTLKVRVNF